MKEHNTNDRGDLEELIDGSLDGKTAFDRSNTKPLDDRTLRIRQLNDQLRIHSHGGMIVCTKGILNLETDVIAAIGDVIRSFDDFNEDNDPHGEHDCAMVIVDDFEIRFKIDYFDLTLSHHSPDASDAAVTKRIITIMLAEEY